MDPLHDNPKLFVASFDVDCRFDSDVGATQKYDDDDDDDDDGGDVEI